MDVTRTHTPTQAVKFLHDKNIPYGHLHTGNVIMVSDSVCKISDVENGILNVPAHLKPIFLQLKTLKVTFQGLIYACWCTWINSCRCTVVPVCEKMFSLAL